MRQSSKLSTSREFEEDDDNQTKSSVRNISPEKREWIRNESEAILAKNLMLREKTKQDMFEKRLQHEKLLQVAREQRDHRWKDKTKHSPFAVNLVAEDERITEENSIRIKEETERRTKMEARKQKAKNEIILKALSEFSDLEALRKEKRAIMDEEQRLKALLSLEKVQCTLFFICFLCSILWCCVFLRQRSSNTVGFSTVKLHADVSPVCVLFQVTVTGKSDRIIAERAQRQRKEAKLAYRRTVYKDSLDQVIEEERMALMRKHGMATAGSTATQHTSYSRATTGTNAPMTPAALAAMTGSAAINLSML